MLCEEEAAPLATIPEYQRGHTAPCTAPAAARLRQHVLSGRVSRLPLRLCDDDDRQSLEFFINQELNALETSPRGGSPENRVRGHTAAVPSCCQWRILRLARVCRRLFRVPSSLICPKSPR